MDGTPYNVLEIYGPPNLVIKAYGTTIAFQTGSSVDLGSAPYTSAIKYWRIRPDPSSPSLRIVGEYSTNGTTWDLLGTYNTTGVPATVGIELAFGTNAAGGMGKGIVDELLVCP
jgi:hypothetical protein